MGQSTQNVASQSATQLATPAFSKQPRQARNWFLHLPSSELFGEPKALPGDLHSPR